MAQQRRIIPKSKLTTHTQIDSVKREQKRGVRLNFDIILRAQRCWDNLEKFRKDRERCKRYTYGDQWGDVIKYDGKKMTEEEYIISQGNIPLKNNLIRRLVRSVMGAYRGQSKEPTCSARDRSEQQLSEMMSITLQYNWQLNRMSEINSRTFEEFLISGAAFHKESFGWRDNKMDCWTDIISPNHIFFDGAMHDVRHWDCSLIGEIHDITFGELCSTFAKSQEDYDQLRHIYTNAANMDYLENYANQFGHYRLANIDFLHPYDTTLCRVIEVWTREQKARLRCHDYLNGDYYKDEVSNLDNIKAENASRLQDGRAAGIADDDIPLIEYEWFIDNYWYYRYLTPFGHILREGETPYAHGSHPYVIKLYPFIDGEIHSFVGDVIDQQRYVNRLITLTDWVIRASAKGVLMFPEDLIPDDMRMEDIAEEWAKFNGVIVYKPKPGVPAPQQIANNSTNVGMKDLLQLQIQLMEEVSGVHGPLQGKQGFGGMSAALYNQQTQNATTSLLDLLESFDSFIIEGAYKKVKNIQQFYTQKRYINIAGRKLAEAVEYDPEKVQDTEFDMSISESTSSPIYRMLGNDFLLEIWKAGQISVEQLLENGSFPFADQLLQSIRAQREQMEQEQMQAPTPQMIKQ